MGKIRTTNKRRQRLERRNWHSNKALKRIWEKFGEVPLAWHRSKRRLIGGGRMRWNCA